MANASVGAAARARRPGRRAGAAPTCSPSRASTATVHCACSTTVRRRGRLDRRPGRRRLAARGQAPRTRCRWEIPVDKRPTTAVLVRTRAQIPPLETALRGRGLPVEVVGLGGLLDTPEVRDVVSTLRVLADPAEGAALLRLLTGPRWRIGPRDLVALYRRARVAGPRAPPGRRHRTTPSPTLGRRALDEAVLVEALDDLGAPERYSTEGSPRFTALRDELRGAAAAARPAAARPGRRRRAHHRPRRRGGRPRPATPAWPGPTSTRSATSRPGSPASRRAPTLSAFLAYLAAAEDEERGLAPGEVEVVEGAVQILTAHAAKGLEWDVVAVAGLHRRRVPGPDQWRPTTGCTASACCRSRCAATAPACPAWTCRRPPTRRRVVARAGRLQRRVARARRAGGAAAGVRRP